MHVGHDLNIRYFMRDEAGPIKLQVVTEKDLGVLFNAWRQQQRRAELVRWNFKDLDKKDFLMLYKTYIRPHLEYCVQAWSPYLERDTDIYWTGYSAPPPGYCRGLRSTVTKIDCES